VVGESCGPGGGEAVRAGTGSAPDALALAPSAPAKGVVHFKAPARSGGIEALELEVEVPEGTARVEFSQDGQLLFQRQRPAVDGCDPARAGGQANDGAGCRLCQGRQVPGEDALVLNGASNQLPVEILLGPKPAAGEGRLVTVSVAGSAPLTAIVLRGDDKPLVRWTACPCATTLSAKTLANTKVLSADATNADGLRGRP